MLYKCFSQQNINIFEYKKNESEILLMSMQFPLFFIRGNQIYIYVCVCVCVIWCYLTTLTLDT